MAPVEEARLLRAAAGADPGALDVLVARRLAGEPLAWITGTTTFCGRPLRITPGVYVPRPQSEALARRALARLPAAGVAVDVCTGSGAVAAALAAGRPDARVLATDVDEGAVACARANGVEAIRGDLCAPVPAELRGRVDVVVGVVPYVPHAALSLLPRDTFAFEAALAYDGGPDGTAVLRRAVAEAATVLRPGGALLLELGGDQADRLAAPLAALGFTAVQVLTDDEGDPRALEATLG